MTQAHTNHALAYAAQVDLAKINKMVRSELLAVLSQARALSLALPAECREKLMDSLTKEFHPDGHAADLIADAFYEAESWCDAELETEAKEVPMTPSAPV